MKHKADHPVVARVAGALALTVALAACATTGATYRSGVGDAYPEHPPYYAGAATTQVQGSVGRIGYLPIVFQRGATQPSMFDPRDGADTPIGALLV